MFNVGGGEFLVILLVALIVLGPQKLPEAARQVGNVAKELKRMSSSFQSELRQAMDEPIEETARERGRKVVSSEQEPAPGTGGGDAASPDPVGTDSPADTVDRTEPGGAEDAEADEPEQREPEPPISTAEAAGMYDIEPDEPPPGPATS